MSRPITISIPKPCHENWQEMTATERGAFCKSCQKEVIDFTKKTEDETHRILSAVGATCGRFRTDQLERPIHQTTYIRSWWHWKAIAASVLSFIGYKDSMANQKADTEITTISGSKLDSVFVTKNSIYVASESKSISGKVVNDSGTKLEDITIELIDSNNVIRQTTTTDGDGIFSFVIDSANNIDSFTIKAYSATYSAATTSFSLHNDSINPIVILSQIPIEHEISLDEIGISRERVPFKNSIVSSPVVEVISVTGITKITREEPIKPKRAIDKTLSYLFYKLLNKQKVKIEMIKENNGDIDYSVKKRSTKQKQLYIALRNEVDKELKKEANISTP